MPNTDKILAYATLEKVMKGEPLTLNDLERWGTIITLPITISSPTNEQSEQMKYQMRQALQAAYFPPQ